MTRNKKREKLLTPKRNVKPLPRREVLLPVLAAISGACGIAYEIVYVRLFSSIFGDTILISSIILLAIFLGIAFGAWKGIVFKRHLHWIEISIGIYAFLIAVLFKNYGLHLSITGASSLLANSIKLSFFLGIPAFLIGTCIPLFVDYARNLFDHQSKRFSVIYALYNLGAFTSVLMIEFFLFRELGLVKTMILLGVINILIGLALIYTGNNSSPQTTLKTKETLPSKHVTALFLASFASGIFQLYILKLSYSIFGPLHENFALVIASAIMGITIGSTINIKYEIKLDRILCLAGLSVLLFLITIKPLIYVWSYASTLPTYDNYEIVIKSAIIIAHSLPVFIIFGMTVPATLTAITKGKQDSVLGGKLLAISSLGNGVGVGTYILALHQFLPLIIIGFVITTVLMVSAAVSSIGQLRVFNEKIIYLIILFLSLSVGSYILWPRIELAMGYKTIANYPELRRQKGEFLSEVRYKTYNQDAAVMRYRNDITTLSFNGYLSLTFGHSSKSRLHEAIVGSTPAIFGEKTDHALVLGLGTGITAGSTAKIYNHTRIVEINPAMLQIPQHFKDANRNLEDNESAEVILDDGIQFLLKNTDKYDAIINTVTSPYYYSASKLYTADFLELAISRLTTNGIYSTWFDANITKRGVDIIINTLEDSFENCRYFLLSQGYFNVVCSQAPLIYQPTATVAKRFQNTKLHNTFQTYGFESPIGDIMSNLEIDFNGSLFERSTSQTNRLDRPIVEFLVSRTNDRRETITMLNDVVEKNIDFQRKLSLGTNRLKNTCLTIFQMSGLKPKSC